MNASRFLLLIAGVATVALFAGCCNDGGCGKSKMDRIAESYVKLVLECGVYDDMFVDAYYGPAEWRDAAENAPRELPALREAAATLLGELRALPAPPAGTLEERRHLFLEKQLVAVDARLAYVEGERIPFDEESAKLYDAVVPQYSDEHFAAILAELESAVPGDGPLLDRWQAYRKQFLVPPDKLDAVFRAAIDECRRRTLEYVELPADESFTLEYVKDQPWGAYNWYKGSHRSLIQVNTDLPSSVASAIGLACHEGYPGHHVFNALLEKNLVEERGWAEYSVYPLFSPQSLIAEGTANYGIAVAFPAEARVAFERDVLFPLAGLDPAEAERYAALRKLMGGLAFARTEAARRYVDGTFTRDETVAWLEEYALHSHERAAKFTDFIEANRSYVINYSLGEQMVEEYLERMLGEDPAPEALWAEFLTLIDRPVTPSMLR